MLSIAIVRARYNPHGGAERFVQRALAALSDHEVALTVIARDWPKAAAAESPVDLHLERVDPFYLGSVWRDWSFERGVKRLLARRRFDLVQSHERIAGLPVYRAGDGVHAEFLAQRRRALPAWKRWTVWANPYHAHMVRTERRMFTDPALQAVICNSTMVRGEIAQRFGVPPGKMHLIRNGVDLRRFGPASPAQRAQARAAYGLPEAATVFAFVGSGFERKGLGCAIRALARLFAAGARPAAAAAVAPVAGGMQPSGTRDARLLVAGSDRHAGSYRRLAERLGVASRITFLGGVDDVRPVLHASDVFVLPTLYDPFPNSALEALACGLPVVTSTKSGAAEMIRPGENGRVIDALDVPALAEAMDDLSDPPRMAARRDSARRSVAALTIEGLGDDLVALYRRLLDSARADTPLLESAGP